MTGFTQFVWRDLGLLIATLLLWWWFADLTAGDGLVADMLGVGLGISAGICAWQAHEWGHWIAGKARGATFRVPGKLWSVYLFGFDNSANSRAQFLVMSLGGFAATAVVFLVVIPLMPSDWLATRVVRGLVLLEIAVTVILEVPGFLLGLFAYEKLPSVDVLGGTNNTSLDD